MLCYKTNNLGHNCLPLFLQRMNEKSVLQLDIFTFFLLCLATKLVLHKTEIVMTLAYIYKKKVEPFAFEKKSEAGNRTQKELLLSTYCLR